MNLRLEQRRHHCRYRKMSGFSLLELLVCISILALLIAILVPAIQSVREASRQANCRNTMRQLGIAAANLATTKKFLPSSGLGAIEEPRENQFDWSFLVQLASYIDASQNRQERIYCNESGIQTRLSWNPVADFYQCPSGFGKKTLRGCANRFNGDEIQDLFLYTVDYAGNGGFVRRIPGRYELSPGGIDVFTSENQQHTSLSSVTDGLAHTVQIWESSSGKLVDRIGRPRDTDISAPEQFHMLFNLGRVVAKSEGRASSKTYLYSVTGIRVGAIEALHPAFNGEDQVMNVSNLNSDPFSLHPGGVNMLYLDGAVKYTAESIDRTTFISSCTRNRAD